MATYGRAVLRESSSTTPASWQLLVFGVPGVGLVADLGPRLSPPNSGELNALLAKEGLTGEHPVWPALKGEPGSRESRITVMSFEVAGKDAEAAAERQAESTRDSRLRANAWMIALAIIAAGLLIVAAFGYWGDTYVSADTGLVERNAWFLGFIRWAMLGCCIAVGWIAATQGGGWWIAGLLPIAIVFNPFLWITMPRAAWIPVDVVAAVYFALVAVWGGSRRRKLPRPAESWWMK